MNMKLMFPSDLSRQSSNLARNWHAFCEHGQAQAFLLEMNVSGGDSSLASLHGGSLMISEYAFQRMQESHTH